jgi:hypothetical protein
MKLNLGHGSSPAPSELEKLTSLTTIATRRKGWASRQSRAGAGEVGLKMETINRGKEGAWPSLRH